MGCSYYNVTVFFSGLVMHITISIIILIVNTVFNEPLAAA